MEHKNKMVLEVESRSCNEGLARIAVAAFATQLNPTLEEVADIKTAVSEAITNCIVHAYEKETELIRIECFCQNKELTVIIRDTGKGIEDVKRAMEPLFTTKPEQDRSRYGVCLYGGLYGPSIGGILSGQGHIRNHEKNHRKAEFGF